MKEQGRNSQDQINKEQISNLPEREFRIMIVKMLQTCENRMKKMQETTQLIQSPRTQKKLRISKQVSNTITSIKNII